MVENKDKKYNSDKQWELVNFCEFDKYATKSYCAIHNVDESKNLGDITKVDETELDNFNMICGGSPCQDFSVAGKQKGSVWTCKDCVDDNGKHFEYNPLTVHWSKRDCCPNCGSKNIEKTRSSLLVEYLRVVRSNRPNFGIYENVKNIVGKQFKDTTFKLFTDELEEYGYNVYWKVLNSKNYGIPQNRERVYLLFIKKDLDNGKFEFPEPFDNGLRLKDLLEDEVDEKFYISDEKVERFITNAKENKYCNKKANFTPELWKSCYAIRSQEFVRTGFTDDCSTLTARDYKDPRCVVVHKNEETNIVKQVGNISDCKGNWNNPQIGRVYDVSGCSPTLNTCSGGGHEPKVIQVGKLNSSQDGVVIDENGIAPTHTAGHGNTTKVLKIGNINPSGNGMNGSVYSENGLSPTLTTNKGEGSKVAIKQATKQGYIECEIGGVADLSYPDSKTRRGRVQDNGNISPTITATETGICRIESPIRIRKLTPKECFRLMGFSDENFDAAQKVGISNSQLYKQAGNSIVVDVLYYIYVELYKAMPYLFDDLKLSSFFSGIGAFEIALDKLYKDINSGNFINPQTE
jgi:DNA (cytosine-5)-methyltransferase 1